MIAWVWLACGPQTPEAHVAAARAADDPLVAAVHFEEACWAGLIEACLERGRVGVGDAAARAKALERACEAGEATGCALRSEAPGDRWDQRGCEAGSAEACLRAGSAVDDPPTRARLLAQACHAGAPSACSPAADLWRALGDRGRAAALYGRHCQAGDAGACAVEDLVRAEVAALAACEASPEACWSACAEGLQAACRVDELVARCDRGEGVACTRRAQQLDVDDAAVEPLLWRACDGLDPWACLLLADRLDAGRPAPVGVRGDATWLREQACDLQLDYGCVAASPSR